MHTPILMNLRTPRKDKVGKFFKCLYQSYEDYRFLFNMSFGMISGWAGSAIIVAAFSLRSERMLYRLLTAGFILMAVHLGLLRQACATLAYVIAAASCAGFLLLGRSVWLAVTLAVPMLVGGVLGWSGWIESGLVLLAGIFNLFAPVLLTGIGLRLGLLAVTCSFLVVFLAIGSPPGITLEAFVFVSSVVGIRRMMVVENRSKIRPP